MADLAGLEAWQARWLEPSEKPRQARPVWGSRPPPAKMLSAGHSMEQLEQLLQDLSCGMPGQVLAAWLVRLLMTLVLMLLLLLLSLMLSLMALTPVLMWGLMVLQQGLEPEQGLWWRVWQAPPQRWGSAGPALTGCEGLSGPHPVSEEVSAPCDAFAWASWVGLGLCTHMGTGLCHSCRKASPGSSRCMEACSFHHAICPEDTQQACLGWLAWPEAAHLRGLVEEQVPKQDSELGKQSWVRYAADVHCLAIVKLPEQLQATWIRASLDASLRPGMVLDAQGR